MKTIPFQCTVLTLAICISACSPQNSDDSTSSQNQAAKSLMIERVQPDAETY